MEGIRSQREVSEAAVTDRHTRTGGFAGIDVVQ